MRIKKVIPIELPEGAFTKGLIVTDIESGEECWIARIDRNKHPYTLAGLLDLVAVAAGDEEMKDKEVYVYLVNFGSTHYGEMIWDKEAEPQL